MYRLEFLTKHGCWVVQFLVLGLFWVSVRRDGKLLTFMNLESAEKFVVDQGIPTVYVNKTGVPPEVDWGGSNERPQVVRVGVQRGNSVSPLHQNVGQLQS